ncbi:MAG: ABC transporter permease [Actinobacteria bacterium]|uniref:Thiamine pyrimidine synthase n=1 Tax=freshwater metagenome TaxID=449393 RepID=A0A6J6HMZ2_9ZZZZ|nr:ABC transporter permease [Actinomycetota bacterium]
MKKIVRNRLALTTVSAIAMASLLAACSSSTEQAAPAPTTATPAKVSIALDYTPNTNHLGVYVAQAKGYFADENLTVKVLPYGTTPPETLVGKGLSNFAFSYSNGTAFARTAGLDVLQVFANIAKTQYVLAYRADDARIKSPKDLDGKTYAGFGTPSEDSEVSTVIKGDGGKGEFKKAILDTAAYDAVYNGKADFTIAATTVEIVEAAEIGKPLKYFVPEDYGYPANYSNNIISSNAYLKKNPDVAKRFLRAVQKGYKFAQENPKEAADILVAANKSVLKNPAVIEKSAQLLADDGYLKNKDGKFGVINGEEWAKFGDFLFDNKLLTGKDGKTLTQKPDWSTFYTNDFVPNN